MSPLASVLSRLHRVRQAGPGQWSAACPAHPDRDPSLSISVADDGRALLHCHAGCTVEAICTAMGMPVRDLFSPGAPLASLPRPLPPPPPAKGRGAGFATRDDAVRAATSSVQRERGADWALSNAHAYGDCTVLRFEPPAGGDKTFRPIHSRDGAWHIGDPPGPLPLYRKPEIEGASVVFVVEGEKAADAAAALGLAATTSAHGAKSAKRADWSPLAGRDVVLLPDNDEPGRGYAREVAEIVRALDPPAKVRLVELPDLPVHGDMVEFIAGKRAAGLDDAAIWAEMDRHVSAAPAFVGSGGAPGEASTETHPPSGGSDGAPPGASGKSRPDSGSQSEPGRSPSGGSGGGPPGPPPEFGEPEPLPNDLPPVDPFDPWMLPRALFGWITDIAERIQCPIDFPAVAAMVALASVLGRKVAIRPKRHDDWLVVANLWGALIGRPGIMKTPPLQEATRPLKRLEIEAKKKFEAESERYEAEMMVFEERRKTVQKGIRKEIGKHDDGGALAIAKDVIESEPAEPVRRRYLVNDSTVEKLGEILGENPNGVLVIRDELPGLLKSLDKEGQESARAFYLEAWNGTGRFTYDRIGRGTVDIEAAIVSMMGSIQPGPLGQHFRAAVEGGLGDDGLMSRFQLAVWPNVSPEWKNVDRWPDTEAKNTAYGVFTWLDRLSPEDAGAEHDDDDHDAIPYLRFDPRAQRVFDRWRGGLERRLRTGEEHPALESHFAKYRSLIPSLALLIHLADGGKGPVGLEPLRKAIAWGRYLSSHARRIYAVAVMDDVAAAKRLVARIRKGQVKDRFTERDVYKNDWSGLDRDAVRKAVAVLTEYGWAATQVVKTDGRPRTVVQINPRILKGRPEGTDKADGRGAQGAREPRGETDRTDGSPAATGHPVGTPPEGTDGTDRCSGVEWGEV